MVKLRSDAAQNREAILDAAGAVFVERGITVSLDLVAERAGVGRATLYRNFADREALMTALLERSLDRLAAQAEHCRDQDDGLIRLFTVMAENGAECAVLSRYWRIIDPDAPVMEVARQRKAGIFAGPLARAMAAGDCRPDLDISDILLISSMFGAVQRGRTPEERQTLARRAVELLLAGIRRR